jgi:hypothetical protein
MVSARKLHTLGVTQDELHAPKAVASTTTKPTAPEFQPGAEVVLLPTPPDPLAGHQLGLDESDTG